MFIKRRKGDMYIMSDFKEMSAKCPAIINTFAVKIKMCGINDKTCEKSNCAMYYWLDKKKESYK